MDYRKTVNLPKTKFSMKAGLSAKEPIYLKRWQKMDLYGKQLKSREGAEKKILHDGPPYANGAIHIGHALNKILKDIINKYNYFKGYQTPYVPGWDCHGLPIELKVAEKLGSKMKTMDILDIRQKCRDYAKRFVDIQKEGFVRLGVFGEWDNPYLTLNENYEASIVEAFGLLVERGYVYRGLRPVYWSPDSVTALAEAEVEYHDIESHSIYVKFPVVKHNLKGLNNKVFVMIWTTTPWTLPANTGLSFHPDETYIAVNVGDETYILAEKLADTVMAIDGHKVDQKTAVTQAELKGLTVNHPWIDRESKVVFGTHVTMDTGTGVVHTAPGHGMEDYMVGLEYGLEILSPVDDYGRFTADVPEWEGQKVLQTNEKIIEFLDQKGVLYHASTFVHSYPHDWRTKTPVIFRSKPQWFFKVSDPELQKKAMKHIPDINWVPSWGEDRFKNMIENRPDWCLSRQRNWGVPIPAFYCENCGEAILTGETVSHIVEQIKKEGIDIWYRKSPEELLPAGFVCPKCGGKHFIKEMDILDVWFDSGVSHFAVLDQREGLSSPADIYLEGSDQYRGWFQSSYWPSLAIHNRAPFKTVVTNGWVLDEHGKQMHKSLGNTVSPKEVYDKFGADVLRLWVVTEDYTRDLRIGDNLIQKAVDAYRKLRNTFRYFLGNLNGFDESQALSYGDLLPLDQYALGKLFDLNDRVEKFYDNFEFHRAFREIYNFCVIDLSNRYLDILKDQLYIYAPNSQERLSAQTALNHILRSLMMMLAPVLPFTMEEIYMQVFAKDDNDSVHLQTWVSPASEWKNDILIQEVDEVMKVRDVVLKGMEKLRGNGTIGQPLESRVSLHPLNETLKNLLEKYQSSLKYWLIASEVRLTDNIAAHSESTDDIEILVEKAEGEKCERCWHYSTGVGSYAKHPTLCERCASIVETLNIEE